MTGLPSSDEVYSSSFIVFSIPVFGTTENAFSDAQRNNGTNRSGVVQTDHQGQRLGKMASTFSSRLCRVSRISGLSAACFFWLSSDNIPVIRALCGCGSSWTTTTTAAVIILSPKS
ncbi:hypothetical protein TNCV_745691 [Trichonephila clavipes]|nr:hypothetical protein TNCV_745691 [Trichonephila clavipes]